MSREKLFSPFKEGSHPLQSLAGGLIKDTPYSLLDGSNISVEELQKLSEEDIKYLQFLAAEATGERGTEQRGKRGYIFLVELIRGLGAYPLRGSHFISDDIRNSVVFRIAGDIVDRAGVDQGSLIPGQDLVKDGLLTIVTVARILGVTRAAVNELCRAGKIKAQKRLGYDYGPTHEQANTYYVETDDLLQFTRSQSKKLKYPERIFSLSDCHGGQRKWNPLESDDVAARLAESIRSDLSEVVRIDTFGASVALNQHIVREALRLHKENPFSRKTGLFINSAPRTEAGKNGEPFYRAEFDANLVVAGTPLEVLSAVRDSVKKLLRLPNLNNGLYDGAKEQHRSSFAVRLLAENHDLPLEEIDPSCIPELPEGCRLTYADRFGNITLHEHGVEFDKSITKIVRERILHVFQLQIGDVTQEVKVGISLAEAQPGQLVAYCNDGNIEIVTKWDPSWDTEEKLKNSAYEKFGRPEIGAKISLKP